MLPFTCRKLSSHKLASQTHSGLSMNREEMQNIYANENRYRPNSCGERGRGREPFAETGCDDRRDPRKIGPSQRQRREVHGKMLSLWKVGAQEKPSVLL